MKRLQKNTPAGGEEEDKDDTRRMNGEAWERGGDDSVLGSAGCSRSYEGYEKGGDPRKRLGGQGQETTRPEDSAKPRGTRQDQRKEGAREEKEGSESGHPTGRRR